MDVIIVDDPSKGIITSNLIHKATGVKCQHLVGENLGSYSCSIHNESWYKRTPCFHFSQTETKNSPCRLGQYFLDNKKL
jgi:hypothetical protein